MWASAYIYGSVDVWLCSVLFYIWFYVDISLRTSASSIFCIFLWFNKNALPHSSELRKHRTRLVLFRPSYFDLDLDIFDSVSRLASYYITYTSVPRILATYICSESHRLSTSTSRLHLNIDLPYTHYYTHPTPLGRVTGWYVQLCCMVRKQPHQHYYIIIKYINTGNYEWSNRCKVLV